MCMTTEIPHLSIVGEDRGELLNRQQRGVHYCTPECIRPFIVTLSFGILADLLESGCTFCALGCWLSFFAKGVIPFTEVELFLWLIDFASLAGEEWLVFHGQGAGC